MNIKTVLTPGGVLSDKFEGYESRPGQLKMAKMVDRAIKDNRSAVIEGEAGVGKSFAYLIPIILSEKKAIISTSHKSLQDQLSKKDLPALKKVLKKKFDWEVLKGKGNYFCKESFDAYKKDIRGMTSPKEYRSIIGWFGRTRDGDIEHFPRRLPKGVKELLTCDTRTVHSKGSKYRDLCFAVKARERASKAKIVITNHTLTAIDISLRKETGGKVKLLPDSDVIVIDEAHAFEEYASMAFSERLSRFSIEHLLLWSIIRKIVSSRETGTIKNEFNESIKRYLPEKKGEYYQQKKADKFTGFGGVASRIADIIDRLEEKKLGSNEATGKKIEKVIKEGANLISRLNVLSVKDENMLRWSEARDMRDGSTLVTLRSVPINISKQLSKGLFNKTVICTSATLAVNKNFSFFRSQMGVPENAIELAVSSPFDFKKNALAYISNGSEEQYYEIEELVKASKGNAFVLFTSYRDMRDFYSRVDIPYPKLIQGDGISRANLLKEFRKIENAVLFATKSFWEGVDVQGDDLVLVIIHKIPFGNPSDLLYKSRIEKVDEKLGKGKHWIRYTIPDACLKLKQGAGRLIRNKTDRGVIALLDARVNYRNYGKAVVNSLPPAPRTQSLNKVRGFYRERGI